MGNNEEARSKIMFSFFEKAKVPDSVIDQNSEPTTFDHCIELVLGHEGGYVDDPNDAGGETNWGISKRAYDRFRCRVGGTPYFYIINDRKECIDLDTQEDFVSAEVFI